MKLKVSEIFYSAQGEGRFVGVPSVFLRTFGCNFTCGGFGMPAGSCSTERDNVKVELYERYEDLPLVNTGCDSYASWDPRFKHLSPTLDVDEVVNRMVDLTPQKRWMCSNGNDVHLVITGGEPLLGWQRAYTELLEHHKMLDLWNLTFETNGTQELHDDFRETLEAWQREGPEVTFSVSAKLSASGETREAAIRPEIIKSYQEVGHTYLKFVVATPEDFAEVDDVVEEFLDHGFQGPVYVMPVGGVVSVYNGNKFNVADEAMRRGYYYSPRLHVDLWGNSWGK
jgi:organic radical activating enzyme